VFGISGKIIIAQTVLVLIMGAAGYWYWSWSQSRISTLSTEAGTLRVAVATQNATIDSLQEHATDQARRIGALQQSLSSAETTRRRMESQLRQLNLALRSRTNPQDVEAEINRTINQLWRDLRALTGHTDQSQPPSPVPQPPPRPPARVNQP
jgi:uncharacterized protein YlxW (UPF0749 family)